MHLENVAALICRLIYHFFPGLELHLSQLHRFNLLILKILNNLKNVLKIVVRRSLVDDEKTISGSVILHHGKRRRVGFRAGLDGRSERRRKTTNSSSSLKLF